MGNCLNGSGTSKSSAPTSRHASLRENVIRFQKKDPRSKYDVIKVLGEGSIGAISLVRVKKGEAGGSAYKTENGGCFGFCKSTTTKKKKKPANSRKMNTEYAMKSIQLRRVTDQYIAELRNEIDILRSMDHPNIVKAYEVYEDKGHIYVIMEYCSGGDLYARKPYSEKESAKIVGKLLSAIKYMHDHNIIHRDLKFENIMFESKHEDAEIKVIDFGLSTKFQPGQKLSEGVGTVYTMAPQVLQGVYTSQADLWSIGVITYMLLSGQKPFYAKRRRRVIDKIMRCKYDFNSQIWQVVSDEAKDFVSSLIKLDPKKRLNATQALKHPWLSKEFPLSDRKPSATTMANVENNIFTFGNTSELKKLALLLIAHKSSNEEVMKLRDVFDQYDSNSDGTISKEEFKEALRQFNCSDEEVDQAFEELDVNRNGVIVYTEFIAATLEVQGNIEEERIADAFDRIDSDDSGFITRDNLMDLLGTTVSQDRIDEIIREADLNNDGKISFDEFLYSVHKDNRRRLSEIEESTFHGSENGLLDVDAPIPGGKHS